MKPLALPSWSLLCLWVATSLCACADEVPPGGFPQENNDNNGVRVIDDNNEDARDPDEGVGLPCQSDADCQRALLCVEGACQHGGGATNNGDGANNGGDTNNATNNGEEPGEDNHGDAVVVDCEGAEVCGDGFDNNCNGLVEEGCSCTDLKRDCYTGEPETAGVGQCRYGEQVCESEFYGACEGEVLPGQELCDGIDNDCDGQADEDWALGEVCVVGSGDCTGEGTVVCAPDGQGTICDAQEGAPGDEVCDGVDNNCDGQIDEGGVCDNDGPEVSCPPDRVAAPLDTVSLQGMASDPDGDALTVRWSVTSAPVGSTAVPSPGNALGTHFFLDLAGDYVLRLTATDARGESASCQTRIQAIPDEQLRVELIWNIGVQGDPSDVDLHLLRSPQGRWFDLSDDCFFRNCDSSRNAVLEWSAPGEADNPRLDLDDVDGNGPENINIDVPQNQTTYRLGVHYWDDDGSGAATVTVRIYCLSQLAREFEVVTLDANGSNRPENQFWQVADIVWSNNTCMINELGSPGNRDIRRRDQL